MSKNELTAEVVKQIVEEVVQREVGTLRNEIKTLEKNTISGFEQVIKTIDSHMSETDTKFISDRKRIERLEKIVLY